MATAASSSHLLSSFLAAPLATPPPGTVVDLENPPTLVSLATALFVVAFIIMALAVALRLFVRWRLLQTYVIEDFLILLVVALMIAYGVTSHELGKIGFVTHAWDETRATYVHGKKLITIIAIIYNFIIIFLKSAILAQFLRIFAPNRINLVMFYSCWALIITNGVIFTLGSIWSLVRCSPIEKNWNPYISGHCRFSEFSLRIATPAANVGTDVLVLLLPLPCIYQLHMDRKKKLLISALFAVGILAIAASTVRLYYTYVVLTSSDSTWNYGYQGIATWFEVSMGSLVVCLPITPRFIQFLREKCSTFRRSKESSGLTPPGAQDVGGAEKGPAAPSGPAPNSWHNLSFRRYLGGNSISLFTGDDQRSSSEEGGETDPPQMSSHDHSPDHSKPHFSRIEQVYQR